MKSLVIFLHGVGSRGADLAPLGDFWKQLLPETDFAAPDAPFPFTYGGDRHQWFSIDGVTDANRPQRVVAAREAFDRVLHGIIEGHGLADNLERVALVGFSQGSIMALDAVASGRWRVGAVVAFAGRLASPEPLSPSAAARLLLVHGRADNVMPPAESERTAARFAREGISVDTFFIDNVGHTVSSKGAQFAGRWLGQVLAERTP